ncbi:GntR family transcriptional regulator, partial [Chachezhania sediminis]|uniref:GntR family transcriptional regulator n=1 Tax=Chachezhania sediminis TaxID=2599291 RepID=UPI00131B33AD
MKKRYPEVAARIMADLRSGNFRVGDPMPSEAVLCARFGASRSTIRSAMAELQRMGMIERKQGAATRVTSTEPPPTYVHSMSATGDLMHFAGPSFRKVQDIAPLVADEALAQRLGDRPGRRWMLIRQTRHIDGQDAPVGWTDVYLADDYADIADEIP